MKKAFVEPKIKRIELNLKENIASSNEGAVSYHVLVGDMFTCTLQNTGEFLMNLLQAGKYDLIETCKVYINANARIYGKLIPEEEVHSLIGR